jgi:hypothetical protein
LDNLSSSILQATSTSSFLSESSSMSGTKIDGKGTVMQMDDYDEPDEW